GSSAAMGKQLVTESTWRLGGPRCTAGGRSADRVAWGQMCHSKRPTRQTMAGARRKPFRVLRAFGENASPGIHQAPAGSSTAGKRYLLTAHAVQARPANSSYAAQAT